MGLLTRMLKQDLVYWDPIGTDSYGKPVYAAPVQMKCRWEDSNDEVLTVEGEKTVSRAKVYTASDVKPRGMLFQGTLDDLTDVNIPTNNQDSLGTPLAFRIIKFDKLPDLKARKFLRTAYVT